MNRSIGNDAQLARPQPVGDLVGKAFRAGSFIPLVVLGIIVALGVPLRQVFVQTDRAESFAAVLDAIIDDRTGIFIEKAEAVASLVGTVGDTVETAERLDQLLTLDRSIRAAVVTDGSGNLTAQVSDAIDSSSHEVEPAALAWVSERGTPFVGSPRFDRSIGTLASIMAVPIESPGGDMRGMLQITVTTDWMVDAIRSTNDSLQASIYVTDSTGRLVAHADEWRVLAGQHLENVESGLIKGLDGSRRIAGTVDVASWRGELIVVSVFALTTVIPGAAAGLIPLLVVVLALAASRRAKRNLVRSVVAPVHALGEGVGAYGPGNLQLRIPETEVEEVNTVARAFNATADRVDALVESLRESNAQLEEFASVAAHDLQEPMRKIRAFGDMLARSSSDDLSEEALGFLERMQDAAARMQQLIDDLLVYSRVSTRAAPFQQVDLNKTVAQVVDDLDFAISEAGAEIDVGSLPSIDAEPTQMYQLLQNLVSNSLKFSHDEIPQKIAITSDPGMNGTATITVADSGIGFSPDHAEQIFGIFERLHGRSAYAGTGIGLALCRKIVERHGGTITAKGTEGEGASFTIELPVHAQGGRDV